MCVTDLDLDLEITEDEQAPRPGSRPGPDPQRAGDQVPGVAWGRAGPHTAAG
jgi:hypothetical protein